MNEKEIQLGEGQKEQNQKYFFINKFTKQNHVHLQDRNLQLTTVVECICANESILPPGFVLEEKQSFCFEWFDDAKNDRNYL